MNMNIKNCSVGPQASLSDIVIDEKPFIIEILGKNYIICYNFCNSRLDFLYSAAVSARQLLKRLEKYVCHQASFYAMGRKSNLPIN